MDKKEGSPQSHFHVTVLIPSTVRYKLCWHTIYGSISLSSFHIFTNCLPGPVAARSKGRSWQLGYWDRGFKSRSRHGCLSLRFCVFRCCVVLCRQRPLRRADNTSKGVLPSVLIGLWNLRCEATKVLTRTVEPLMMTTTTTKTTMELFELLNYKGKKIHVIEGVKISVPIKCLMYDTNIKKNYQSTLINRYIGKIFRYWYEFSVSKRHEFDWQHKIAFMYLDILEVCRN
jgi:hypothetical protein